MQFDPCSLSTPPADLQAIQLLVLEAARTKPGPINPADPVCVVEVGSWVGRSALAMASVGPHVRVHCVDTWLGSLGDATLHTASAYGQRRLFETFCKNVGPLLLTQIFPHVGTSELWAGVWPRQVDVVYLDAGHLEDDLRNDIKLWTPHVRPGGILAGHDYGGAFDGVTRAVDATGGCRRLGEFVWARTVKG